MSTSPPTGASDSPDGKCSTAAPPPRPCETTRCGSGRFPSDSEAWDITMDVPAGATVIDASTFSKWGPELAAVVPEGGEMVLTGVATDCCVLSTALGALDAGRFVTVVSDACAAVSDEAQQQTLALLQLLSPMCEVVTSRELLARATPAERT
ncbi:isochorismatase family protein [Arthrobacter sp. OAP107]|uniref:cysteine hydrolase family protein n=1 Tax=Arthrobacter sp. OAP107 TaxID=3156445 RepID=UPI00339882E3